MTTVGPSRPEGLYDEYAYYENNFTDYDHPEGVDWKYMVIIKPGIAILHNGLPERTDYNDSYNLYLMLGQMLLVVIDLCVQGLCTRTLWKSKSLSKSVKCFLVAEAGMRIHNDLVMCYQMQCTFNWSCVDDKNYPFSWLLLNQVTASISAGQTFLLDLWALGLSTNRIFAIFFNGLYYQKVERFSVPYMGTAFLLIEGLHLSMISRLRSTRTGTYYYTGYVFMPHLYVNNISYFPYSFAWDLLTNLLYLSYGVIGLSLTFDLLTLWKIRKMKKLSSNTKSRADFKLAVMLITTHFFNALFVIYFQFNSMMLSSYEPLLMFLIYLPSAFFPTITGATITAFNYPFKARNKKNRVIAQTNQGPNPRSNTIPETQVTKVD